MQKRQRRDSVAAARGSLAAATMDAGATVRGQTGSNDSHRRRGNGARADREQIMLTSKHLDPFDLEKNKSKPKSRCLK